MSYSVIPKLGAYLLGVKQSVTRLAFKEFQTISPEKGKYYSVAVKIINKKGGGKPKLHFWEKWRFVLIEIKAGENETVWLKANRASLRHLVKKLGHSEKELTRAEKDGVVSEFLEDSIEKAFIKEMKKKDVIDTASDSGKLYYFVQYTPLIKFHKISFYMDFKKNSAIERIMNQYRVGNDAAKLIYEKHCKLALALKPSAEIKSEDLEKEKKKGHRHFMNFLNALFPYQVTRKKPAETQDSDFDQLNLAEHIAYHRNIDRETAQAFLQKLEAGSKPAQDPSQGRKWIYDDTDLW